jgi:peptidoglycan/LPS O-acetylase OafA/YrhL
VLLYHAQVPGAAGGYVGVDMFFVISGFLITGLILNELETTSTLSLKAFYGRRMKRLLPAIVVVLLAVVALSWFVFSPLEQERTAWDVVTAGAYVINWRLAAEAVDYGAGGLGASPVQHFWTLAVEEQFYIVWPPLLLGATWWWRTRRAAAANLRLVVGAVVAGVAAASFAYNLFLTGTDAGTAYFSTFTRAWEFTLGAGLALISTQVLRYPRVLASVLAWGGLAAIAWSVTTLDDATPFPGRAALVPTLATVAIIVAGFHERPVVVSELLGIRPMRHIGRVSYSWYLWHWPPLVFAAAQWGELSVPTMVAISAATYVPALLAHQWVERPVHHHPGLARRPTQAISVGMACTAASVGLGLLLLVAVPALETAPIADSPGAQAQTDGVEVQEEAAAVRPSPMQAYDDRGQMHDDGCLVSFRQVRSPACVYGNPDADTTVVLFGDSTAMHYFPALERLAERREWRLVGLTKAGCSPALFPRFNVALKREYTECYEWRDHALGRIADEEPDMIVLAGRADTLAYIDGKTLRRADSVPIVTDGWAALFERLRRTGAQLVLMKDGPRPDKDIPECVSANLGDLPTCAFDRDAAFDYVSTDARAARRVGGVHVIDLAPLLCNADTCPAVIGNVIVYRQTTHFTASFMETLTRDIARRLPDLDRSG